jgi:hypothetical protein
MRRKLDAVFLLAAMFFILPLGALAGDFKNPRSVQPPPGYDNLTYTRTQGAYIDFKLVDPFSVASGNPEGGYSVDFGPTAPYRSTAEYLFAPDNRDAQGNLILGDGWGFINPNDILTPPTTDLTTWLNMLEWPKSGGWYNVTDAGEKQGSNAIRNIYYHMPYGTIIARSPHTMPGYSKTNPYLVSPGPYFDVFNDGQYDYRGAGTFDHEGANGKTVYLFNLTKDGAIGILHRLETLYPNTEGVYYVPEVGYEHKKVAYTVDLAVTQLTAGLPGSDGLAPYAAVIENLSPFEAHNALFELYVWPEGDPAPIRVDSRQIDLPRASVAAGTPGAVTLTGFFAAPVDRSFRLVASINAPYDAGGSVLGANPGKWAKQPYSPVYKGSVPPGIGAFMEPYYDNNVKATNLLSGAEPPDSGGGGGGSEPPEPPPGPAGDLIAASINLYNPNGSLMGDSLMQNTEYTVRANFRSTFDQGGYAQLRLYVLQDGSYQLRDSKYAYFEPGGSLTWESLSNSGSPGSKTYIATVNLWRSDGGSWDPGQFTLSSGSKVSESTYDNNKIEKTYSIASEGPPSTDSNYASYYPLVTKLVPRYRTEKIKVWVPEVRKVPVYFDQSNPKIRVRLIPEESE